MSSTPKRVGILNGGGDCPSLNTVIDAVVKSLTPDYEVIGFIKGFEGLLEKNYITLDRNHTSFYRWIGGSILKSTNKGNFPGKIGVDTKGTIQDKIVQQTIQNYKDLELEGLIVLGGDGTLSIAHQLQPFGMNMVGVPKSIDNDLECTDFTFGFQSAVDIATEALDRLHTTAFSHDRVMILEVMGRHAGWIGLYSGLAGGANVILIPEIPFSYEKVLGFLEQRKVSGKSSSLIVVSEGAISTDGKLIKKDIVVDPGQAVLLGGIGHALEKFLNQTGFEARSTALGHVQRGGSPNAFDRILASQFGAVAANLFREKKFGKMVVYRNNQIQVDEISQAIDKLKIVDPNGQMVQLVKQIGISFGD